MIVIVLWLFPMVALVAMQCVIVKFLDYTRLLNFLCADKMVFAYGSCNMKM